MVKTELKHRVCGLLLIFQFRELKPEAFGHQPCRNDVATIENWFRVPMRKTFWRQTAVPQVLAAQLVFTAH
jgi:hypothetical protein